MRWLAQELRKAACWHDWRVTRFDARILGEDGRQYELEMCPFCMSMRRGAVVKRSAP